MRTPSHLRRLLLLVPALALLDATGGRLARAAEADEFEIKATMLGNVLRLVEWPAAPGSEPAAPLVVGIIGSEDMESALRKVLSRPAADRTAVGRPISVRRLAGTEGLEHCQAVFVGGSDRKRLAAVVQAARALPILTVGESDRFVVAGGMIALVLEENHVQVGVNLAAAQAAGLQISSRLLRIATIGAGGARS